MDEKYRSFDINRLELENADTANIVEAIINDRNVNRSERRKILKSLGKYQNYNAVFNERSKKESDKLLVEFQKVTDEGLGDNWQKMMALCGLTLKRKYNWSAGRVGSFLEKANNLHREMILNDEWDSILKALDEECDVQLEISND